MKKIISIILIVFAFFSCEDLLDSENKIKKDTSNYPATPRDASQLLTGVYSILGKSAPLTTSFMTSEILSDDRLGGGGPDDRAAKAIDQFLKSGEDMFLSGWKANYTGIFRSNFLISVLDQISWSDDNLRNRLEGEVHFMRAYFYFDLSRMFGEVPLVTIPDAVNIPKSPAVKTYALIASDLKTAIEKLPSIKYQDIDKTNELGHATKWAAEALMARVFLFYTGYYQKEELQLPDGSSITKEQVKNWLVDCIENSGHDLVGDFRNLWPYSYVKDYSYTVDNGLEWVGDGNIETVFSIKFSSISNWSYPYQKSNQICLYFGLRGQSNYVNTYPFGAGWGMGPVNPHLWNEWSDMDIRKKGSILNVSDRTEARLYQRGGNDLMDETLFWQKKYIPVNVWNADNTGLVNYSCILYGMKETNYQLNNTQDLVTIRFADILLMAAELGALNAQDYLDKVRARVNLPSVPATLENIKKERHYELAFEGVRYYDLLRWHDEELITTNQTDIPIFNKKIAATKSIQFRAETRGFLPIPKTEIDLSGGILTQNPGWDGSNSLLP